jgi:hypothetical protein
VPPVTRGALDKKSLRAVEQLVDPGAEVVLDPAPLKRVAVPIPTSIRGGRSYSRGSLQVNAEKNSKIIFDRCFDIHYYVSRD